MDIEKYMRRGRVVLSLLSSVMYLGRNIARITNDYWPSATGIDDAILESEISEKLKLISSGLDAYNYKDETEDRISDLIAARQLLNEFNNELEVESPPWGGPNSAFGPLELGRLDDSDYGTDDEL